MIRLLCLLLMLLVVAKQQAQPLSMMEWNVENLFHPSDNPQNDDDAFTPDGEYHWTYGRFMKKCNGVAQVVAAAGLPDLVALCEVEDDSTMIALTRYSVLRRIDYQYVMTHGCDARGVNVALLYKDTRFRLLAVQEVKIPSAEHGLHPTRNMLYVKGEFLKGDYSYDTLHVVVCHLPSNVGTSRNTDKNRRLAFECLKTLCDSILQHDKRAALVVTGDFNTTQKSKLLRSLLGDGRLHALKPDFDGTYRFRGVWSHLDHAICSSRIATQSLKVLTLPFMLEPNATHGGDQPFRTFRGPYYHSGISDHLPILWNLGELFD